MARKCDVEIARHRLDGGDPEARIRRLDLLLAGDERHRVGADPLHGAVIDLARQQPQRQADQPGRMRQHPLDGEMGLAGIGRAQHGGDAGATGTQITIGGRRERNRHQGPGIGARLAQQAAAFCITTRRWKGLCLRCGTSLEQIAAESATRRLFEFVHRDIWRCQQGSQYQIGWNRRTWGRRFGAKIVNGSRDHNFTPSQEPSGLWIAGKPQAGNGRASAPTPAAITGSWRSDAAVRRLHDRDEFRRLQQAGAERRRHREAERHQHARAGDRCQPHFGVAQRRPDT